MKKNSLYLSIALVFSAMFVVSACTIDTNKGQQVIGSNEPTTNGEVGLADCTDVADGEYAPAYDGCNKCMCQGGKAVSCTEKACNPPSVLEQ